MVQSPRENKTLKNALDAMKNTPIPVAVRMVDTGIGVKIPYVESSTVGEVAGKFSKASTAAKDDAYQLAKGSGGVKGTGESRLEYLRGKYGELTSEQLHANINERAGIAFPQRSTRSQLKNGGYIVEDVDLYKKMSPNKNRALGFRNTKNDGLVQAHHAIQDEWAKIWAKTSGNNYSSRQAPSILLKSTSGEPHAIISALQRARRRNEGFSTNIIYEFNISYKEMIEAGVDLKVAKKVMREAYRYFDGLGGFK